MFKPEKKQIVMSVAVGVLGAVFVFFQYLPLSKKAKALNQANAAILSENNNSPVQEQVLTELKENIETLKKQIGDFNAKVPLARSHGLFLQNLASIMKKQGLKNLSVQPGNEQTSANLSQIPINVKCEGKLLHIFNFLKALESFERVIQIENLSINADDKLNGNVAMQAKVNIFYRLSVR